MEAWAVKVFQRHPDDDSLESCPSEDFFRDCPHSVATDLIAIIDSVAAGPPPQFRGGAVWQAMHGIMRGFYFRMPPEAALLEPIPAPSRSAAGAHGLDARST